MLYKEQNADDFRENCLEVWRYELQLAYIGVLI
jgi:hypothetical protein